MINSPLRNRAPFKKSWLSQYQEFLRFCGDDIMTVLFFILSHLYLFCLLDDLPPIMPPIKAPARAYPSMIVKNSFK